MTRTTDQDLALDHLRAAYVGPEHDDEVILNRPDLRYVTGMLFPVGRPGSPDPGPSREEPGMLLSDVAADDVEEDGAAAPLAEEWKPSSVAISFVTNAAAVRCHLSCGTYRRVREDGPPRWERRAFLLEDVELSLDRPPKEALAGDVPVELGSRWRKYGDSHLVTVHVRALAESTGDDRRDVDLMLYQVALSVGVDSHAQIFEYDLARSLDLDDEAAELRLRYRDKKIYAVGHGMAADWNLAEGICREVHLDPVPAVVVPAVETRGLEPSSHAAQALELAWLSEIDSRPEEVLRALDAFVASFSKWADDQDRRAATFGEDASTARAITYRALRAADRMRAGVEHLRDDVSSNSRTAFALGMAAMRLQLQQAASGDQATSGSGHEPRWRPFQLGFLLVALASTVEEGHQDRDLVDLIWFPTGGGKTEAYLGLTAIEIFRRRLDHGVAGAGTAVITRYTLRLLTAQQFQRTASLICAMELLRLKDSRARGMSPFSIGLWVGNEVTPGTKKDAKDALDRLHRAAQPDEANQFQVESCPWCLSPLVPRARSADMERYGMRMVGQDLVIHCTEGTCPFHHELPVVVVDEALYEEPPTVLLATVDKFARLQFKPEAGRLLGLNTTFRQPSLIIQDELHLLSGPLGTTVAVFDAVIQLLLSRAGSSPKIIASTATIRASQEQVQGLYGRTVALYPPAGLDGDNTFFSRPVENGEGRLYTGLMPQSFSQASAMVATAAPLIELPEVVVRASGTTSERDAYWTSVMYHNSLRELGRTRTLVVDDVNGRLESRAERLGLEPRPVRASRVLELTSRRGPDELPKDLRELGLRVDQGDQAIDVVLSSNMLSVGVDVPRLALMLMVGQPKTTAEYIQATSRVGRGAVRGIVATLFRSNRARDRSHFETFRAYHEVLYRNVEPTSVTPWSVSSRERSLPGALVALFRHYFPTLADNDSAIRLDLEDDRMATSIENCVSLFVRYISRSDDSETTDTEARTWSLLREWDHRARSARMNGTILRYERRKPADEALLKRVSQTGQGWVVADSMRSVEPEVAVHVREPWEGEPRGPYRS